MEFNTCPTCWGMKRVGVNCLGGYQVLTSFGAAISLEYIPCPTCQPPKADIIADTGENEVSCNSVAGACKLLIIGSMLFFIKKPSHQYNWWELVRS